MSGVAGGERIKKENYISVIKSFERTILLNFLEYVDYRTCGSFESQPYKEDFGDIDIICQYCSSLDKKDLKKKFIAYIKKSKQIIPFKSKKYRGKLFSNTGEIVSLLYPQPEGSVQIDVIFAMSKDEAIFKQNFLNLTAEKQGLLLGLVKCSISEFNSPIIEHTLKDLLSEPLKENQELEFNLSSTELQLRLVTYQQGTFKQESKEVLWTLQEWYFIDALLGLYNLEYTFYSLSFEDTVKRILILDLSERSRKRIAGIFESMVTVKSGEVDTSKGNRKEHCIELIKTL